MTSRKSQSLTLPTLGYQGLVALEHKGTVYKNKEVIPKSGRCQNKLPGQKRLFSFPFSNRCYVRVAVETVKQNLAGL